MLVHETRFFSALLLKATATMKEENGSKIVRAERSNSS